MKSPPESHNSPHCGVFSSIAPRRMRPWCLLVDKLCKDIPHVSRTKGHSESTSLLGARPTSCAHCLVLAETVRFCATSAEAFEYHDPSGRSGLPSARMFWRLWCASQSPGKLGSKQRGLISHSNSCCEVRVHSLDKFCPSLLTLGEERTWYASVRFAGKRTNLLTFSHLACAKGLIP